MIGLSDLIPLLPHRGLKESGFEARFEDYSLSSLDFLPHILERIDESSEISFPRLACI